VVVLRRGDAERYPYPDATTPAYEITRLARARQQPELKPFLVRVLPGGVPAPLRAALHHYVFNVGEVVVHVRTRASGEERVVSLGPGDSAYVAPMVDIRLAVEGPLPGELYIVRVPGALHATAVFELSGMAPAGLGRAATETTRWF